MCVSANAFGHILVGAECDDNRGYFGGVKGNVDFSYYDITCVAIVYIYIYIIIHIYVDSTRPASLVSIIQIVQQIRS